MLPFRQCLQPDVEHLAVLLHIVAADKPHHRVVGGDDRMNRHFRFFTLGVDNGFAMRHGAMDRAAVQNDTIHTALVQPTV
ncbi:hypothetical protein D3C85_1838360 [compost metagenome]